MKKIALLALLILTYCGQQLTAQHQEETLLGNSKTHLTVEYKGMEIPVHANVKNTKPSNQLRPEAMFDIQFVMRANDSLPAGIARRGYGILWTGTEFWLAQWTSDSIARYSKEGRLLGFLRVLDLPAVLGNSGIRHFTREDNNVWAVNNSEILMRLDPITGQILQRVTMPTAIGTIRYVAWDATEGGGFWVGNSSTDLFKISKTGQIIRTIPRSIHGIAAMTGLAYDSTSQGGPYLWVNCQALFTSTLSGTFVRQIKVFNGFGTSLIRDIKVDIPAATSNLSGSLSLAQIPGFNKPSLLVVAQNTTSYSGAVIGYELNFAPPTSFDIGIDSFETAHGFTVVPRLHRVSSALRVKARNIGFVNATNIPVKTEIFKENLTPVTSGLETASVPSLNFGYFNVLNSFVAADTGNYIGIMTAKTVGDANPLNDTARLFFQVKDSTYAKDFVDVPNTNFISFSLGTAAGAPLVKKLGTIYRFPVSSTINSVTFRSRPSIASDSLQIQIYRINSNGQVGNLIAESGIYYTTAQDSITSVTATGAIIRTLRLKQALSVAANDPILICLAEGSGSMRLSGTTRGYQRSNAFGFTNQWINMDTIANANFRNALYLRPNVHLRTETKELTNFESVAVFPNPVHDILTIQAHLNQIDDVYIKIYDLSGRLLVSDKVTGQKQITKNYPLSNCGAGLYFLKMESSKGVTVEKFVKD